MHMATVVKDGGTWSSPSLVFSGHNFGSLPPPWQSVELTPQRVPNLAQRFPITEQLSGTFCILVMPGKKDVVFLSQSNGSPLS